MHKRLPPFFVNLNSILVVLGLKVMTFEHQRPGPDKGVISYKVYDSLDLILSNKNKIIFSVFESALSFSSGS